MPWDKYPIDAPRNEFDAPSNEYDAPLDYDPYQPVEQPANLPEVLPRHRAPDSATMDELVREASRVARETAISYVRDSLGAAWRGEKIDHRNPTITATDHTGRELVVADAKNRSWRTLFQGLAIDILAALVVVVGTLTTFDPFVVESWTVVGALFLKTIIQAVVAYFMRLKVAPTVKEDGRRVETLTVSTHHSPSRRYAPDWV